MGHEFSFPGILEQAWRSEKIPDLDNVQLLEAKEIKKDAEAEVKVEQRRIIRFVWSWNMGGLFDDPDEVAGANFFKAAAYNLINIIND